LTALVSPHAAHGSRREPQPPQYQCSPRRCSEAEFRCVSGEFQIVDVGSLNGTYVNGEPVDSAVLANGDEVQIGKFRLVFLTGPTTGDTESVTS
jgi:hypothetical protein